MGEDLRLALLELLRKAELDADVDFQREGVLATAQQLMELEVAQHVGLEKYPRAANTVLVNATAIASAIGIRASGVSNCEFRVFAMTATTPALLQPRRRGERALVAVVQEDCISGVSTRHVDHLVKALGIVVSQRGR